MGITRHFVSIGGGVFGARQVHYRRAGNGPAVLLLHQSPMSSRDLLPVIERWQSEFTLIAPDTPGYGLSDPFGREPVTMEEIADGVIELLDALGIDRVAVYGFHTGAMIVGALASRHPQRLSCAVANGYVVMDEAARADFLAHYLPRFEPRWDGGHLSWLWARLREQTIFFPWYRASQATRMRYDVPKTVTLRDNANEFLRAGDHYRVAYHAAFAFESVGALRKRGRAHAGHRRNPRSAALEPCAARDGVACPAQSSCAQAVTSTARSRPRAISCVATRRLHRPRRCVQNHCQDGCTASSCT